MNAIISCGLIRMKNSFDIRATMNAERSHAAPSAVGLARFRLTSNKIVNCSRFSDGFTVCGSSDGITRVAIIFTDRPYFLSLNMRR